MNMSSLRITKTDAMLDIRSTPAKISQSQPKADFEIHQKHAKVKINTEPIQIRIDQSQCFNEAGLKNNTAFMEDMVQRSKQDLLQGIDRIVSEGNTMAAIESKANAIVEIAASNSIKTFDFNIDFVPKSRPNIDFVGGTLDIQVDEGYVEIKSKPNNPIFDVEVGGVEINVKQHAEVKIEYIGNKIDTKL